MRYLVASALLLACALVLLWRELAAPVDAPSSTTEVVDRASRSTAIRSIASPRSPRSDDPLATPLATAASPPGGVRAWSPMAAPVDGPDPFAPIVEVRTADDTRAGLADEKGDGPL